MGWTTGYLYRKKLKWNPTSLHHTPKRIPVKLTIYIEKPDYKTFKI